MGRVEADIALESWLFGAGAVYLAYNLLPGAFNLIPTTYHLQPTIYHLQPTN